MSIRIVSFNVVSLMAMVPDSEWRTPTLMVSCAAAAPGSARPAARIRPASDVHFTFMVQLLKRFDGSRRVDAMSGTWPPRLHLELDADASLLRVDLHRVVARVLV